MKTFVLPYPPSANRYWRNFRGIIVVSSEARAYKKQAGLEALAQGVTLLEGPVAVGLAIYRPQRRGDIDNSIKVLLDSLNGIAWEDDSQITELHAFRYDDKVRPRVEVTVSSLDN